MNKLILLILGAGLAASALSQEPPGCAVQKTTKSQKAKASRNTPKPKLRGAISEKSRTPARQPSEKQEAGETNIMPVIARLDIPRSTSGNVALTASGGYLYVVSGDKIYKIDQTTLRTIKVSTLGTRNIPASDSEVPRKPASRIASKVKMADVDRKALRTKKDGEAKRVAIKEDPPSSPRKRKAHAPARERVASRTDAKPRKKLVAPVVELSSKPIRRGQTSP